MTINTSNTFFTVFTTLSIIVPHSFLNYSLSKSNQNFEVYCTSNLDSTGVCTDESNTSFSCIIIPGQIIECKDKKSIPYECVLIAQITQTQAEFSCSELGSRNSNSPRQQNNDLEGNSLNNVLPNELNDAF